MDIYGTIGPACARFETLVEMFQFGMNGMRLNLSHTDLSACRQWTAQIQKAAEAVGISPRLLVDLQGPELRIGELDCPLHLREKQKITLISQEGSGKVDGIPVPQCLFITVKPGQEVLVDDGKILLMVENVESSQIFCQIRRGGTLVSRKSIALLGGTVELPTLTESDRINIREAKSHGVTGVMLPFVRGPEDLMELKAELEKAKASDLEIFAKIENMDGVRNLENLFPYADQIVIARGDLGNRMPLWELPVVQAQISQVCREAGKPFMVVTQMLASMENSKVPTRAEVSDIFRAVSEGASSVMVTGETASGRYPAEVMKYLCKTVDSAERYCRNH